MENWPTEQRESTTYQYGRDIARRGMKHVMAAATTATAGLEKLTYTTQHDHLPAVEKSILIVGSTGSGKSTLANFLLYADKCVDMTANRDKNLLEIAWDNKPCTRGIQGGLTNDYGIPSYSVVKLRLIDTPGLNESSVRDLEHMIGIIESINILKKLQHVSLL